MCRLDSLTRIQLWSATPTPLKDSYQPDLDSIPALAAYQLGRGVQGFFVGGTCGEGPWLSKHQLDGLWSAFRAALPNTPMAVQVTDNSFPRILENIEFAAGHDADLAVIAEPYFLPGATESGLLELYSFVLDRSPLPICLYCRGHHANVRMPPSVFGELLLHGRVVAVKDSSGQGDIAAAIRAAKKKRPGGLFSFYGDETRCLEALQEGYDGLLLGGAVFHSPIVRRLIDAFECRDSRARNIAFEIKHANRLIYGPDHAMWLSGLKYYLFQRGLSESVRHHLPLGFTGEQRSAIERFVAEEAAME
jgi:dihydrodipicolinate synthase/N-acetylneuraminate lyase